MRISDWSSDVCSSDLGIRCILPFLLRREGFRSSLSGSCLIDPDITHDPIHPAIQPRALRPQMPRLQRTLQRRLAQVIAIRRVTRSEERRVGTECVSTCRSRGAANTLKKKTTNE